MMSLSSRRSLGTPRHHQNLRGKQLENPTRLLGSSRAPRVPRPFGNHWGGTIASPETCVQLCSPKAALRLPYPDEEILSSFEEDVSFIRAGFTSWVKADFETLLERHAVDIRKALAEFREASARRHDTSHEEYRFDNVVPNRSPVQKRLSIYNLNPGPRRGREGAIEKQIEGKWHIIT